MTHPNYGFTRELPDVDYDAAVTRTIEALKTEGFGVLTTVDVKATMKAKLDVDFKRYVILGACNPTLAHRAFQAEPFIGLFLPCNVVVMERDGGGSIVSVVNPDEMFRVIKNPPPQLCAISAGVVEKLRKVLERV